MKNLSLLARKGLHRSFTNIRIFVFLFSALFLFTGMDAFAETPEITVRFGENPVFNCAAQTYCIDVEFQSDTPDQILFGMNVRFFYDEDVLEFISFGDFQGGYGPYDPDPPLINIGTPASGDDLFGFGGAAVYLNGAIKLVNYKSNTIYLSTDGWTKIFNVCFQVKDPGAIGTDEFCPSVVWDLEYDPADGSFLHGSDGVVITLVDQQPNKSTPSNEQVVQFNWDYDQAPGLPFGNPLPIGDPKQICIDTHCTILAVDDAFSGSSTGDPNIGNAIDNDTVGGAPAIIDFIDISVITPATPLIPDEPVPSIATDTGTVSIPPGTPAGIYSITYRICITGDPGNCDDAIITITVLPPKIVAKDDDFTSNPLNGNDGGVAGNVLTNDELNDDPIIPTQVGLVTITVTGNAGITDAFIDNDGYLHIPPGTPAGTYTLTYQICEILNPTNCAQAIITIKIFGHVKLIGQLKYYNAQESPMPTPFNTNYHGMPIPDYFYISLFYYADRDDLLAGNLHPHDDALQVVSAQEIYGEEHDFFDYELIKAAFIFEDIDPFKEYMVLVWDGGYFNEADNDSPPNPGSGVLGQTWTWNNWGGVNATDALLIQKMVIGVELNKPPYNALHIGNQNDVPSYWFFADDVADVNKSESLTALDALLTMRRGIGLPIFQFFKYNFAVAGLFVIEEDFNTNNIFANPTKDLPQIPFHHAAISNYLWTTPAVNHFYHTDVIMFDFDTDKSYLNIYYNAVGDINSSYIPFYEFSKDEPDIHLIFDEVMGAAVGDVVDIPVKVDRKVELGAISLGLQYRGDLIEVIGTSYDIDDMAMHDAENGIINLAWTNRQGHWFAAGDTIASIRAIVLDQIGAGDRLFELTGFTELADKEAHVIKDIRLAATALSTDFTVDMHHQPDSHGKLKAVNFPNPFKDATTIRYTLPEPGDVRLTIYNMMGQVVSVPVERFRERGSHEVDIKGKDLIGSGIYYYRIELKGSDNYYSTIRSMVFIK